MSMNHKRMQDEEYIYTAPNPRAAELEELLRDYGKELRYPAKKIFLEPGDELTGLYYIVQGRTWHYMIDEDGSEKKLYTLSAGWFYGEAPIFMGEPTGLYSRTEVDTVLYKIGYSSVKQLFDNNSLFRETLLECVLRKMLIMRHEIENLTFNSTRDRLIRLLCSTADTEHPVEDRWYPMKYHYTQYELGTMVGSARITISKLINELCGDGTIRILNHKIQISAAEYARWNSGG